MALEDGVGGACMEKKFWKIPELVEKLLPHLDLDSIKRLAESHELTRKILEKPLVWKKLIKRVFSENIKFCLCYTPVPSEDYELLASDRPKAKILAEILHLLQDSLGCQLEMDLLHAVCDRHAFPTARHNEAYMRNFVNVSCVCLQSTHEVTPTGFVLLEDIQSTLGPREQRILEVDKVHAGLSGPFLMALSSMTTRQQGMEMKILVSSLECNSRESVEAIENVAKFFEANRHSAYIDIGGEIGGEGWAAMRRIVEHLVDGVGVEHIQLEEVEKQAMVAGAQEDLRAIWAKVAFWIVVSDGWRLEFSKCHDGERGGWEGVEGKRKGIEDVIHMSKEEWVEEAERNGGPSTISDSEESESEESEAEGEGDSPGPE